LQGNVVIKGFEHTGDMTPTEHVRSLPAELSRVYKKMLQYVSRLCHPLECFAVYHRCGGKLATAALWSTNLTRVCH